MLGTRELGCSLFLFSSLGALGCFDIGVLMDMTWVIGDSF